MSKRNHRPAWTPLQRATLKPNELLEQIPGIKEAVGDEVYINSRYQVIVHRHTFEDGQELTSLSIRNLDRSAKHDWRDFQRIKNEMLGEEQEAVEVYPRESMLVDTSNQYWLWSLKGCIVPFGFRQRLVSESSDERIGGVQRRWDGNSRPKDVMAITVEQIRQALDGAADLKK